MENNNLDLKTEPLEEEEEEEEFENLPEMKQESFTITEDPLSSETALVETSQVQMSTEEEESSSSPEKRKRIEFGHIEKAKQHWMNKLLRLDHPYNLPSADLLKKDLE